jgi:tRNA(Arg) A34 adenosine deaminase TadA
VENLTIGLEHIVWKSVLLLAWESFASGSVPVGAAILAPDTQTIFGRSRASEQQAPLGEISNSRIAHAEINALAKLPVGEYRDHILISTYEPCIICTTAARHSKIDNLVYAASDPLWTDINKVPDAIPRLKSSWPKRILIDSPKLQWIGAILPVIFSIERSPMGSVARAYEAAHPRILAAARAAVTSGLADKWKQSTLAAATDEIEQLRASFGDSGNMSP